MLTLSYNKRNFMQQRDLSEQQFAQLCAFLHIDVSKFPPDSPPLRSK